MSQTKLSKIQSEIASSTTLLIFRKGLNGRAVGGGGLYKKKSPVNKNQGCEPNPSKVKGK
jgi:hypothetical protein